jgi:hypothetical protein
MFDVVFFGRRYGKYWFPKLRANWLCRAMLINYILFSLLINEERVLKAMIFIFPTLSRQPSIVLGHENWGKRKENKSGLLHILEIMNLSSSELNNRLIPSRQRDCLGLLFLRLKQFEKNAVNHLLKFRFDL